MRFIIKTNENGRRSYFLDSKDISSVVTGVDIRTQVHRPPEVTIHILPNIEIDLEASVFLENANYKLKVVSVEKL